MLAGQVIAGGSSSRTVTVKVHCPPAPVQVTVVVPTGNVDPEAGVQEVAPEAVNVTTALH
jgi:hypothetical protein